MRLAAALAVRGREHRSTLFADHTYLQPAQPSTVGHYLTSFAYPVLRDAQRLLGVVDWLNGSPCGAGAVNGSRLVYPMEGQAMRFLNRLGNVFFAKALSAVLETRIGDSLCGTKLLAAHDYARAVRWRERFGDFDPFGDFELLFPAAVMGLGIRDVPIRYMARTYGSTNISRIRDGARLLRMTLTGLLRITLGQPV